MALPWGALSVLNRPTASSEIAAVHGPKPLVRLVQGNETRRGLLSFLLLSTTAVIIPQSTDSKTALLQDYLKRSKENKTKNDKERLDDYYKRNYKDYFELVEGSMQGKSDELLSETEKGIRNWLQKNKK